MGFFDLPGAGRKSSSSRHHHHSSSRHGSKSAAPSFFSLPNESSSSRHGHGHGSGSRSGAHAASSSFFGLPNASSRSLFSSFGRGGGGGDRGSSAHASSYYRRSPRASFLHRAYKKLRRLLRDLLYYAKKHPLKVFMLAIMPLITGGALTALLARFGLRMPQSLEKMLGMGARAMSGDSVGLVGEAMRMAAVAGTGAAGASGVGGAARAMASGAERDYFGGSRSRGSRSPGGWDDGRGGGGGGGSSSSGGSGSGSGWGGSLAGISKIFA